MCEQQASFSSNTNRKDRQQTVCPLSIIGVFNFYIFKKKSSYPLKTLSCEFTLKEVIFYTQSWICASIIGLRKHIKPSILLLLTNNTFPYIPHKWHWGGEQLSSLTWCVCVVHLSPLPPDIMWTPTQRGYTGPDNGRKPSVRTPSHN